MALQDGIWPLLARPDRSESLAGAGDSDSMCGGPGAQNPRPARTGPETGPGTPTVELRRPVVAWTFESESQMAQDGGTRVVR